MSFDEFKGWLRGWLENLQDMDIPTATARILEELEKVDEVAAAPVVPWQPIYPPSRPFEPWEVSPYPYQPYRWIYRQTDTTTGNEFVWNEETVARFNEYKPN